MLVPRENQGGLSEALLLWSPMSRSLLGGKKHEGEWDVGSATLKFP